MTFWYGSLSADSYHWLTELAADPALFIFYFSVPFLPSWIRTANPDPGTPLIPDPHRIFCIKFACFIWMLYYPDCVFQRLFTVPEGWTATASWAAAAALPSSSTAALPSSSTAYWIPVQNRIKERATLSLSQEHFAARNGFLTVLGIRNRIRMILGLSDPDPLVRGPDLDPSLFS